MAFIHGDFPQPITMEADDSEIVTILDSILEDSPRQETVANPTSDGVLTTAETSGGNEEVVATEEPPPKKRRGRRPMAKATSSSSSTRSVRPKTREICQIAKPQDETEKKLQKALKSRKYRAISKQKAAALQKELQEAIRERDNFQFQADELKKKVSELKEQTMIWHNKTLSMVSHLST